MVIAAERTPASLHTPSLGGGRGEAHLAAMDDEVTREFERIARQVYSGKLSAGNLDAALHTFVAESLFKGVEKGFKAGLGDVDYTTPHVQMLAKLEQNTWWFSHAKTHAELLELNVALLDENGRLRQFGDFKNEALKIHERYNVNQLRSEYHYAVASSQMAARWVDIQEAKDTHPFLKYQTAGDGHVRPEHAALDGVVKPVDDAFWDRWYPPNDWGCRCDVVQVAKGKETPDSHISLPPVTKKTEIFEYNPGKAGMVYPPGHPYYDLLSSISNKAKRFELAQSAWDNYAKHSQSYARQGKVLVHALADQADLAENLKAAGQIANRGKTVRIRPHSRIEGVTNPELEIDGEKADLKRNKHTASKRAVKGLIEQAADQDAAIAVIQLLRKDLTADMLIGGIRGALIRSDWNKSISTVLLLYDNGSMVEVPRSVVNDWKALEALIKSP